MKIVVCIKQVPDTTEVKLDPETGTLIRKGVPSIINPDDKRALEAALVLKDQLNGDVSVTVVTMGPPQAERALKQAFAMGADRAILLTDRKFGGADTWATSYTLAAALKKLDYDMIFAGRQAIDGDTAQVGPQIAEHLSIPHVSYVSDLELEEAQSVVVKRAFEDGYQKIRVKMPCLVTTLSEMNTPRYMTVGGVFDAYRGKEIETWDRTALEVEEKNLGIKGSPTRVKKSFTKPLKEKGFVYDDVSSAEAAKIIVEKLTEKYYI
jgi:electron transfer flavoprotein beta subunit